MIGIPQLRRDEDILTRDGVHGELCRQCLTHRPLIPIAFRAIQVTKAHPQCVRGRNLGFSRVRDQRSETQGRDSIPPGFDSRGGAVSCAMFQNPQTSCG